MDEGDSTVGASLWELCEGNLVGDFLTGDPERDVEKALETGIPIGAPLGNLEGGCYTGGLERRMKEGSRKGASLSEGAL
jgi:hypothetical protein